MADPIKVNTAQTVSLYRGQTRSESLVVYQSDGVTRRNISGAEIILTVKDSYDGAVLLRISTSGGGIVTDNAESGEYTYTIADSATDGWNPDTYSYDIIIQNVPNSGDSYYHVAPSKFKVLSSNYRADQASVQTNFNSVDINDALIDSSGNLELDGDKVDIDFTPSNYTPDAAPAEAADVDDLAAHLKGIDTKLGAAVTDHGALTGLTDDDHTQYILADATRNFTGSVLPANSASYDLGGSSNRWRIGYFSGDIQTTGGFIRGDVFWAPERAAQPPVISAGFGYIWVKNTTPNKLYFTDDAGTDYDLTAAGGGSTYDESNPIYDSGGTDELLAFTKSTTPVNHVSIGSADAGSGPTISAVGDDANVDLVLAAQGTGNVLLGAQLDANGNVISLTAGTQAAPGLVFGTDVNSGWYHVAEDRLALVSGGQLRMQVDDVLENALYGYGSVPVLGWTDVRVKLFKPLLFDEVPEPSTPAATELFQYAYDNAGTQELRVKYDTGSVGVLGIDDGSLAVVQAAKLYFDTDRDTYISAVGDDALRIFAGGNYQAQYSGSNYDLNCAFWQNGRWYTTANTEFTTTGTIGATYDEEFVHPVSTRTGAFTLTLPTAAASATLWIYDNSGDCTGSPLTIAANTGDNIHGGLTLKIDQDWGAVQLRAADTTTWVVMGGQGYSLV